MSRGDYRDRIRESNAYLDRQYDRTQFESDLSAKRDSVYKHLRSGNYGGAAWEFGMSEVPSVKDQPQIPEPILSRYEQLLEAETKLNDAWTRYQEIKDDPDTSELLKTLRYHSYLDCCIMCELYKDRTNWDQIDRYQAEKDAHKLP